MTEQRSVLVGETIEFHNEKPFVLIAGPCAIESEETVMTAAAELKRITDKLGIPFVFKSSFDKANRTSIHGKRGVGIEEGLRILQKVQTTFNVPVITDIHNESQIHQVAEIVDLLQIPAFLNRQADLVVATAETQKVTLVKKAQYASAKRAGQLVKNFADAGNHNVLICERGMTFGHDDLVVDYSHFKTMKDTGYPLIMDATHSAQKPGGNGDSSGGRREAVLDLAKAAVAIGVAGVFMEVHPDVDNAISDKENQVPLDRAEEVLTVLKQLDDVVKSQPIINL
jgi:2-dehydro-3-deoxyphosphooctonate aldolase (KDO 8-P synthase)